VNSQNNQKKQNPKKENQMQITTKEELERSLQRVGDLLRDKSNIENGYNDKIQALQKSLSGEVTPLNKELDMVTNAIKTFADANKENLMRDSKTFECATGKISYRTTTASVATRFTDKLLNALLEKHDLVKVYDTFRKKMSKIFLNVKLELDKKEILKNQESAKETIGAEIKEGVERFYIKTATVDTELEVSEVA
jgi:phage host-nuclease inhibitor protein Gam